MGMCDLDIRLGDVHNGTDVTADRRCANPALFRFTVGINTHADIGRAQLE